MPLTLAFTPLRLVSLDLTPNHGVSLVFRASCLVLGIRLHAYGPSPYASIPLKNFKTLISLTHQSSRCSSQGPYPSFLCSLTPCQTNSCVHTVQHTPSSMRGHPLTGTRPGTTIALSAAFRTRFASLHLGFPHRLISQVASATVERISLPREVSCITRRIPFPSRTSFLLCLCVAVCGIVALSFCNSRNSDPGMRASLTGLRARMVVFSLSLVTSHVVTTARTLYHHDHPAIPCLLYSHTGTRPGLHLFGYVVAHLRYGRRRL
ncbi:hypothetical protein EDB85DRAFT_349144 [Lactarius pseudohatsudake]|nr:hypothetical protein EDB85DRAFT_349144 [Lactarius pseudohatsudake]